MTVWRWAPTSAPTSSCESASGEHDALGRDPAEPVGEVPERHEHPVLDPRDLGEREVAGQGPRAADEPADEHGEDLGPEGEPQGRRPVDDREPGGLEHAEAGREGSHHVPVVRLPRAEDVPGAEQLDAAAAHDGHAPGDQAARR